MYRLGGPLRLSTRPSSWNPLRPTVTTVLPTVAARAWESTAASGVLGGEEDGHIGVETNESVLFLDNLSPPRLSGLLSRIYRNDMNRRVDHVFQSSSMGLLNPLRQIKSAIPDGLSQNVTEILPRLKDGGAYVKFNAPMDPKKIEETLAHNLREKPLRPWFNPFGTIKARLVRGTPWIEDLQRYPSSLVKVEFVAPNPGNPGPGNTPEELSEETLYSLFRKYGKISDIIPQPQDDKTSPRYATLIFFSTTNAIMARNCMHGYIVGASSGGGGNGTKLRMSYQKRLRPHTIWNWFTNHPRIVIPIVAALIAGISVVIFDPIRQFFIKMHIQHSLRFTESRLYKWFKTQTDNLILIKRHEQYDDLSTVWNHRRDLIEQLRAWLDGSSDSFIVVTGPKGSGKKEMVTDQSLEGRTKVLQIDCHPITEAKGESGIIRQLAAAVGYRPVFSWANSISSMVDLAVQSTTGVKAGFSETLESQVNKILYTTTAALKEVSLSGRSKKDKDANLSDAAYLEAHPEKRAVVVIDNFAYKGDGRQLEYERISEWAASLIQNNVAHVIFLTTDASHSKSLSRVLPDRVLRTLSLGDLEPEVAKKFVIDRITEEPRSDAKGGEKSESTPAVPRVDLTGLDESIKTMGGRLTDLEFLSRRIKSGQTPKQALDEIVSESATDITKVFLVGKGAEEGRKWSTQQAWHLIKSLAKNETLRYNEVLLSTPFASSLAAAAKDGEAALESLSETDLIAIKFHRGRPQTIKVGKPLNQAAFAALVGDNVLRAKMDLAVLGEAAKVQAKSIESTESELVLLGSLPKQTRETGNRVRYLLEKLDSSQSKITNLEREMEELKKGLGKEF